MAVLGSTRADSERGADNSYYLRCDVGDEVQLSGDVEHGHGHGGRHYDKLAHRFRADSHAEFIAKYVFDLCTRR
jgi:hypothetical protein